MNIDRVVGYNDFVTSVKEFAVRKGRDFHIDECMLRCLYSSSCRICEKNDRLRSCINVAMVTYSRGYTNKNVFPVCGTCQRVRHGLTVPQLVVLAANTVIYSKIASRLMGGTHDKYKNLALGYLKRRVGSGSSSISVRAYSTNYATYKSSARRRCLVPSDNRCPSSIFALSRPLFDKIKDGDCFYCGLQLSSGIDRLYPTIGYIPKNSVPCCKTCNYAKNTMHPAAYVGHMALIFRKNVIRCV